MNITSPSSPLEQTNFVLEDWGTSPSDSSIEISFRTCSVAMEANGSGYGCGLELVFPRLPSSSCLSFGLLTWDPSGCLGWIVMVLIEPWTWVEHCGSSVGNGLELNRWVGIGVTKIVLLWLESIPLTSRFIGTR
ncbi:hypothetical protein Tco_0683427 [Tanacetum coccineum]|uniref:Uncharacterized protein n=1 Tax=Tanacetum coccineum TaxID=301880 RepID=A0ABQ4XVP6_9ASTR